MKISVCIATYNGEKFIRQQLQSIICQLADNDEVIVSDDGSTDATLDIIRSFNDNRIHIFHNDSHYFKWNFINALSHCSGDVIFLADQDDVWLEGKVKRCVELLRDYDLVIHDSKIADGELNVFCESFFDFYHSGAGVLKNSLNNTYFGSCMAFRRSVLEKALPFPKTNEIGHDIWLGLVAEMTGKVLFLHEPYLIYRRHDLSRTNLRQSLLTRSKRSIFVKVWSRVIVLYHVCRYKLHTR
jgi:glycosyltransferase involved in cell wall biosynthesis